MLGATKEVTLAPRGTEEVEGVLAAETRAGAEDEDEGVTVQAAKAKIEGAVSTAMAHRGSNRKQLERGGLTENGDEKGVIRPQAPNLQFKPPLQRHA